MEEKKKEFDGMREKCAADTKITCSQCEMFYKFRLYLHIHQWLAESKNMF
jgi:hypothetical protein